MRYQKKTVGTISTGFKINIPTEVYQTRQSLILFALSASDFAWAVFPVALQGKPRPTNDGGSSGLICKAFEYSLIAASFF